MDRETALRKILKCLELSKSSEPHEAARALQQAQKLMEKFNVDHPELQAVGVLEDDGPSRARKNPPAYEVRLAQVVGDSFGCNMLFVLGSAQASRPGMYRFIGVGTAAQVASYTFVVLARKLTMARTNYVKAKLGRYTKNKVAAADEFCHGWVRAVSFSVLDAPADEFRDASLLAYMARSYPELDSMRPHQRELANNARASNHRFNGFKEGQKAHVNVGISSAADEKLCLTSSGTRE